MSRKQKQMQSAPGNAPPGNAPPGNAPPGNAPPGNAPPSNVSSRHLWVGAAAQILTAIAGMTAIILSFMNLNQSNLQFSNSLNANKEIKTTETLLKSVELLSSQSRATRVGALVMINQLLSHKPGSDGYLIKLIANYVRDKATAKECADFTSPSVHAAQWPPVDVTMALEILSNYRVEPGSPARYPCEIDLHGICMEGADLTKVATNMDSWILKGANLKKTNLSHVSALGADFTDADLSEARLDGTLLGKATLHGCILSNAFLEVNLDSTDVRGTDFSKIQPPFEIDWSKAKGDRTTKLPKTIALPKSW